MASLDPGGINDYLSNAQSVLAAGRRLRAQMDSPVAERRFAVQRLEEAAAESDAAGGRLRAFMFEEAGEGTAATASPDDALALITTDIHIANVLIAAGQTIDEGDGITLPPALLDEALVRLDGANRTLSRAAAQSGTFHFSEDATPVEAPDDESALESFRQATTDTLNTVVTELEKVARAVVESMSKLPIDKVATAIAALGSTGDALPRIGRLLRQGIEKLESALNALMKLLGSDALKAVRERVEKLWLKMKEGEALSQLLRGALHIDDTQAFVNRILASGTIARASLNTGSTALVQLSKDFEAKMSSARTLSSGAAFATGVLLLTPMAPQAALFAAGMHAVILAGVLLIALDYTDSGTLTWVRGVRDVTSSLQVS